MTLDIMEFFKMACDLKKRREEMGFVCAGCGLDVKGYDYKANNWYYTEKGQMCHECGKGSDPWQIKT